MGLLRLGRKAGRLPRVILVEAKHFGEHHNQCAGVLSPPGWELLREVLGAAPPGMLIQRRLEGYVLHGRARSLVLNRGDCWEPDLALRRVEMDDLLLRAAERAGAEVQRVRATGIEIGDDRVTVYTEGSSLTGDVVVGAFALDETMARAFSRSTKYRPPAVLETLACKIHPAGLDFVPDLLGDRIHVFLPRLRHIEFGALIPKGNHITVVIAGVGLTARDMDLFLTEPSVAELLPPRPEPRGYYRGAFPLGPATGTSGHRYVTIGDAAGLARPFKGKGINYALASGLRCARTITEQGISAGALASVARDQSDLTRDVRYGRLVRRLVMLIERLDLTDTLIAAAGESAALRQVLFDCVSGRTTYRDVVWRRSNLGWLPGAARRCIARVLRVSR
jgi:flavin-dependent dehydrogenase